MYYNFVSQINNASMRKKEFIEPVFTKLNLGIANVLKEEGFILDAKVFKNSGEPFKRIRVDLKYDNGVVAIKTIKPYSTPSLRKYKKAKEVTLIRGGRGTYILSTSKGVVSAKTALKKGLGGEVLCLVY